MKWNNDFRERDPEGYGRFLFECRLRNGYGITVEQYEEMLKRQKGGCAICGKRPGKKRLHVDHNHETGQVRGLLCAKCNGDLQVLESPGRADALAEYLRLWGKQTTGGKNGV